MYNVLLNSEILHVHTYRSVHQATRHQNRVVHHVHRLDELLHQVDDALARELVVIVAGDPTQGVSV